MPTNHLLIPIVFVSAFVALILYFRQNLTLPSVLLHLVYCISGCFVCFLTDYFDILIAFEFLAISGCIIAAVDSDIKNATLYGAVNFLSGAVILAFISYNQSGNLDVFGRLILITGVLMHCGAFPFSSFIVRAYSGCKSFNAVFLQIFSTKAALVVLYRLALQDQMLLYAGVLTVLYAVYCAIFESNPRKTVAYNTIGQIGLFILAIYSGGNVLPHLVASILYQTLLYLVVFELTECKFLQHDSNSTAPNGLIQVLVIVTFAMSAFPLTMAFATKSIMLHQMHGWLYVFYIISSFALVAFVPIKIIYKIAFAKKQKDYFCAKRLFILSAFCAALFYPVSFENYGLGHVVKQSCFVLLLFATCWIFKSKLYKDRSIVWSLNLQTLAQTFCANCLNGAVLRYNRCCAKCKIFYRYSFNFVFGLHKILSGNTTEATCIAAIAAIGLLTILNFIVGI